MYPLSPPDKEQKQPLEAFCKKVFLEIWQNSYGNTCARGLYQMPQVCNFIKKETLA